MTDKDPVDKFTRDSPVDKREATLSRNKVQELRDVLKGKKDPDAVMEEAKKSRMESSVKEMPAELPEADRSLLEEEIRMVNEQLTEAQNEAKEAKERVLRLLAEFENFKKRMIREQTEGIQYANEKIIRELLPVIDHLEMTLTHAKPEGGEETTKSQRPKEAIVLGIELILKQFLGVFEKFGVQVVYGLGAPFNPHHQETIGMLETNDFAPGSVALVHRKGFLLNGRLLRAALVTIAKEPIGLS